MNGNAMEQAEKLYANLKDIDNLRNIYFSKISPVLGVHTGPGLIGVAYRVIG
jgi:fatty acid-binding protein DegV